MPSMNIFMVGGAVRDALLGLPTTDRDWVVVGASPEHLVAQGYKPVGKDFPVFLHPQTHEEYALARTERKTAPGYHGFLFHADPGVTLEQDLARRDLTINAIAQDAHGNLIDPYGGQADLQRKVLRHVTPAFAEDPVRILRVARFAARLPDFSIAPETMALMRTMVQAGEANALVAERVWQELAGGLMQTQPARMLQVLRECGALEKILPEVNRLWGVPQRAEYHPEIDTGIHLGMVLNMAAQHNAPLPVRFACLCHDLGKGTTPQEMLPRHLGHELRSMQLTKQLAGRLRVPKECSELAQVVAQEHGNIHRSPALGAAALVRLLERCDAFRKPARFEALVLACACDAQGRLGFENQPYTPSPHLLGALKAAQSVPTETVAQAAQSQGLQGLQIGQRIHQERTQAVQAWLTQLGLQAPPEQG